MMASITDDYRLYVRLLRYVFPYWKRLAVSLVLLVLLALTEPLFPALLKPLLDDGFTGKNPVAMRWIPVALISLFLFRGLLGFTSSYLSSWVANRVVTDLRNLMFARLVCLPTRYYDHSSSGALCSKVAYDANNVTSAATQSLTIIVRDSFTVTALLIWLFWLNWTLTLVTIVLGPLIAVIVRYFNRRLRGLSERSQKSMAAITHVIEEAVSGHKIIKVFCAQEYENNRFRSANEFQRGISMRIAVAASAVTPLVQVLASIAIGTIISIALNFPSGDSVSAGNFVSFLAAMVMLLAPTKRLTEMAVTLQRGLAAAQSVFELIDEPIEPSGRLSSQKRSHGEISFQSVSFTYQGANKYALNKINLDIRHGETIAFVGRSGSGKTTITNLLTRFYEATSGRILLDGQSIGDMSLESLRDNISLVSQDVRLFDDTIAGNVAYGNVDVSQSRIIDALKAANAWGFVEGLPNGIETLIGQNGVRLSGGQRQRIAIARAFFKNAPILIMDEATSALDTESERSIQGAIDLLMKDRTALIIAHRLSTIENADRIIVMDCGRIVETGGHAELLSRDGLYAHFYKLQFSENA